jgi:hypothetical protein
MDTTYLSNEWIDLIRDEAMLAKLIEEVIQRDVVGTVCRDTSKTNEICLSLAHEVARSEGYDLEFVYDLEIIFNRVFSHDAAGDSVLQSCKVTSLFLHEKAM